MSKISSLTSRHEQYIAEHHRMARLFTTDRFAFELERKRILKESIDEMCNPNRRRAEQKELDKMLKKIGSRENRFALIQAILWHHMINKWQPKMSNFSIALHELTKGSRKHPPLKLVTAPKGEKKE